MQDRVPVNPGRVLVTPENGSAAYYATMTRADNPTQEGTPLNKSSLLKDATAALFGLGTGAVPDDVLQVLSRFHAGMGNEHIWEKYADGQVPYVKESSTKTNIYFGGNTSTTYATASKTVKIENGEVVLAAPESVKTGLLIDYYYKHTDGIIYRLAKMGAMDSSSYINFDGYAQSVDYAPGFIGYVNSPDINAYPPAEDDGFTYGYLGQLGSKANIFIGSYAGTGTQGSRNPITIACEFTPQFVAVFAPDGVYRLLCARSCGKANTTPNGHSYGYCVVTWGANSISWYATAAAGAEYQMNTSGATYYYCVLG